MLMLHAVYPAFFSLRWTECWRWTYCRSHMAGRTEDPWCIRSGLIAVVWQRLMSQVELTFLRHPMGESNPPCGNNGLISAWSWIVRKISWNPQRWWFWIAMFIAEIVLLISPAFINKYSGNYQYGSLIHDWIQCIFLAVVRGYGIWDQEEGMMVWVGSSLWSSSMQNQMQISTVIGVSAWNHCVFECFAFLFGAVHLIFWLIPSHTHMPLLPRAVRSELV